MSAVDSIEALAERLRASFAARELPTWGDIRDAADAISRLYQKATGGEPRGEANSNPAQGEVREVVRQLHLEADATQRVDMNYTVAGSIMRKAAALLSRLSVEPTADQIFDAIKHGDATHRQWLREALDAVFAGKPVPPPLPPPE